MIEAQHQELDPDKRTQILLDITRYLLKTNYQLVIYASGSPPHAWGQC